jgi:hypothetical protein
MSAELSNFRAPKHQRMRHQNLEKYQLMHNSQWRLKNCLIGAVGAVGNSHDLTQPKTLNGLGRSKNELRNAGLTDCSLTHSVFSPPSKNSFPSSGSAPFEGLFFVVAAAILAARQEKQRVQHLLSSDTEDFSQVL